MPKKGVTFAEFIVVYLSSGAPFGVLVFFSSRSRSTFRSIAQSVLAAVLWPIVALYWAHRRLLLWQQGMDQTPPNRQESTFVLDPLIGEYETLTKALFDSKRAFGNASSELFQIAGHSNPKLAAICAERKRNALLDSRQRAAAAAMVEHLRDRLEFNGISSILAMAERCRQLGDSHTADLIGAISVGPTQRSFEPAEPAPDRIQLAA